jgi:hypothetical protein
MPPFAFPTEAEKALLCKAADALKRHEHMSTDDAIEHAAAELRDEQDAARSLRKRLQESLRSRTAGSFAHGAVKIGSDKLKERVDLMIELLFQGGFGTPASHTRLAEPCCASKARLVVSSRPELMELWIHNGTKYLNDSAFQGQALLLMMVVLRCAGWHLPAWRNQNEADFSCLFQATAALDRDETWWGTRPLNELKAEMEMEASGSSRGRLHEAASCGDIARRIIDHLMPVFFSLLCCDDRGHAAAALCPMGRDLAPDFFNVAFMTDTMQFASAACFAEADHFADARASTFGLPTDAPWALMCSVGLGGRRAYYHFRTPALGVGETCPPKPYLCALRDRLCFLAERDIFHFVSPFACGTARARAKLVYVLWHLHLDGPGVLRSGLCLLSWGGLLDVSRKSPAEWYEVPGSRVSCRVPVWPVLVETGPHEAPPRKQGPARRYY